MPVEPTSLTRVLAQAFTATSRSRGERYAEQGRVKDLVGDDRLATAMVSGGRLYDVSIEATDEGQVTFTCDCPYYASTGPCKHLWAVIVKAEEEGLLGAAAQAASVSIESARPEDAGIDDGLEERFPVPAFPAAHVHPTWSGAAARGLPWKEALARVQTLQSAVPARPAVGREREEPILYAIDIEATLANNAMTVRLLTRYRKKNGLWSKLKARPINHTSLATMQDPLDRDLLPRLLGAMPGQGYYYGYASGGAQFRLVGLLQDQVLIPACEAARLYLLDGEGELTGPLRFEPDRAYGLELSMALAADGRGYEVTGVLAADGVREPVASPLLILAGGWIFWTDRLARLRDDGVFPWITLLREQGRVRVPQTKRLDFLAGVMQCPAVPSLQLPPELRYEEVRLTPRPRLAVRPSTNPWQDGLLQARLSFLYGDHEVGAGVSGVGMLLEGEPPRLLTRDAAAEQAARDRLRGFGARSAEDGYAVPRGDYDLLVPVRDFARAVRSLVAENWRVEASGKLYRQSVGVKMHVAAGIDWFELQGEVAFEGRTVSMPALLATLRKGEQMVTLDDGTFGVIPESWLERYAPIAALGRRDGDQVKFSLAQTGLLDALLAAQPEATCDEAFEQARTALRGFERIEPLKAGALFVGTLRPYQEDGLGWMKFLRDFGMGGCLADDMGLGKTVQVLAMLAGRRRAAAAGDGGLPGDAVGPALVVAPRSLIFNWHREATRFSPALRVLDYTGTGRHAAADDIRSYDLMLTTYGTLRRDITVLKDVVFDYVILDEAQSVKNASTNAAKAVRLLNGRHRLALSGTPIENHLGELWSLFEFLNPGMLGTAAVFQAGLARNSEDAEARGLLSRALRPFILRRTKRQVARDLPDKTEETLYCELEPPQRKLYDELRDYYRESLLRHADAKGMRKVTMHVLEALLRLRQAACHTGLLSKAHPGPTHSAKFDTLLPQLAEVVEEGHKALVFSQFTELLRLLRGRLDAEGQVYEYLDGKTRDREARVTRFQNDPACKLFLVSLKAGGLGLNLTAAEYVFLLDPWWNPAVEAQAIDRTHRIGQTQPVFAYRLIARDTVEERILELQRTKRDLADSIITADNSLIRNLKREDLELLLS
ncbi:MAG: DEAD/DEAH box helicase [Lentisphaerae bacterium]|nr:DEAD/DEAH box helicase [Lentisphaerota bacterium]